MIKLSLEQQRAYDRFIRARDRLRYSPKWIPRSDVLACIDVAGLNHPMYIENDDYIEYKEAFAEWLEVEPEFRKDEQHVK
jgi:hypothetical protein